MNTDHPMSSRVEIAAAAGDAPAWLFASPRPSTSGIILFMDVFGIRPALLDVAERLCTLGHHVLLPDLYYRLGTYDPVSAADALAAPPILVQRRDMRDRTPISQTVEDTPFFVDVLASQGASGRIGVLGYCMGGARAMRAADAVPGRIAAAASIHGGNLAIDEEHSPHLHLGRMTARLYVGCAGTDPSFPPAQSGRLAEALRNSGIDYQLENYVGCEHGWAIPDNPIFNSEGSERHWRRLAVLFDETLR
jgi:carboxymethylenebutenolidase